VRAAIVLRDDLDVFITLPAIEFVLEAEIGEVDRLVEVREVVVERPFLDLARVTIRSPVAV
jgi:hypothetical protein